MFPPGQPQPLAGPQMPGPMGPMGQMAPPQMGMGQPQDTSQMGFGQPMMPPTDPNALLAALMGGNDALAGNLMALFAARQQNPNALGDSAGLFEPPQPQQSAGAPLSMMPGLPF